MVALGLLNYCYKFLCSVALTFGRLWQRWTTPFLSVGNYQVQMGQKIAEGGFSWVFEATDKQGRQQYALKRIYCPDEELLRACQAEAAVHRAVQGQPHCMPLLAMSIPQNQICYMLFPLYRHSLRDIVNRRTGLLDENNHSQSAAKHNHPTAHHPYTHHGSLSSIPSSSTTTNNSGNTIASSYKEPAPWPELRALQIFHGIVLGMRALHHAGYAHCDIKLENVLLDQEDEPVLMDFGSATNVLTVPMDTRSAVRQVVERASQHTTLPYRPPELLEGGMRVGDAALHYTAVDVWSAGCTLFALLYGASPFEGEFSRQTGKFRVTDCTPLSILRQELPQPAPHAPSASWYSDATLALICDMLHPNRHERIPLDQVLERLRQIITHLGGNWQSKVFRDQNDYYVDDVGNNCDSQQQEEEEDDGIDEETAGGIALLARQR